jgi:predicted nucleic acid-binding protein
MKRVLVDTSVWIDYFSTGSNTEALSGLLERNRICTNDVILSELIPFLKIKNENEVVSLLLAVEKVNLNIHWDDIIRLQLINLKNGINKVGIPDLLVLQNVMQNNLELYTLDKHFRLMQKVIKFNMY